MVALLVRGLLSESDAAASAPDLGIATAALMCLGFPALWWTSLEHEKLQRLQASLEKNVRKLSSGKKELGHRIRSQQIELTEQYKSIKHRNKKIKVANQALAAASTVIDKVMSEGGSLLDQFRIKWNDLELNEPVGEGSFGTVRRGAFRGREVAVKMLRSDKIDERLVAKFKAEVVISECGNFSRTVRFCFARDACSISA